MKKLILDQIINNFFEKLGKGNIENQVYNEFSLQHELGFFIRKKLCQLGYIVQFERNVKKFFGITKNTIKKEMDIVIFTKDKKEKYAIELKFPTNGQYPEQMYKFIEDIVFIEQLKKYGFKKTYSIVLVNDKNFYAINGNKETGIYKYFRKDGKSESNNINGTIEKPTGKKNKSITLEKEYCIKWQSFNNAGNYRYYIVSIE